MPAPPPFASLPKAGITQRGNNRDDVFFVDDDRRAYLDLPAEQADRFGPGRRALLASIGAGGAERGSGEAAASDDRSRPAFRQRFVPEQTRACSRPPPPPAARRPPKKARPYPETKEEIGDCPRRPETRRCNVTRSGRMICMLSDAHRPRQESDSAAIINLALAAAALLMAAGCNVPPRVPDGQLRVLLAELRKPADETEGHQQVWRVDRETEGGRTVLYEIIIRGRWLSVWRGGAPYFRIRFEAPILGFYDGLLQTVVTEDFGIYDVDWLHKKVKTRIRDFREVLEIYVFVTRSLCAGDVQAARRFMDESVDLVDRRISDYGPLNVRSIRQLLGMDPSYRDMALGYVTVLSPNECVVYRGAHYQFRRVKGRWTIVEASHSPIM